MTVTHILLNNPKFRPRKKIFETPTGRSSFQIIELTEEYMKINVGGNNNSIKIPTQCFNDLPKFLSGKKWMLIGSIHGKPRKQTLDYHTQQYTKGVSAASYIAPLLEEAGIVEIDRSRPNKVRLLQDQIK